MSQAWHRLVSSFEQQLAGLEVDFHRAYWDAQIKAAPENDERRAQLELELRRLKGDPEKLERVNEALAEEIHEPLLRRQLEILRLSLTGNQMQDEQREQLVQTSTAVESDFASHRAVVDGRRLTDNEIDEILRSENDESLRRSTWEASKSIGARVSSRVRELARLRNEMARDLGFGDYYQLALDLQEMEEDWLFGVLAELESLTDEPFRSWKRSLDASLSERFGTSELYPWHYADPFFQGVPPDGKVGLDEQLKDVSPDQLVIRTFADWGIDLRQVVESSDLYPRENKCQHAFCLDVDRDGDVRILANVVPGERWVEVMLHESGHAAYDVSIDPDLPYLLRRPAHTFVTEGMAILSGRLVRNPTWLRMVAGVPSDEVKRLEVLLGKVSAAQSLVFMRWGLVMVYFERALYDDPEADLDSLWWDLVERFQLVPRPPERTAPDWAAKIHVAVAPVYYHNYLLGELLASQLERTCVERCGGLVGSAEAGRLLRERLFAPGAATRWDELIESATGKPLSAADFAAGLTV